MRYLLGLALLLSALSCDNDPEITDAGETEAGESMPTTVPGQIAGSLHPLDSISLLIDKEPGIAKHLLERARLNLIYQDINGAREDINRVIQLDSNSAVLHELKGELHYMTNQTRMAKEEWEKCLALDPDNSICIMSLVELLIAVRDFDRAFKLVNHQLELDETDAQAYFAKGIIVRDKFQDTALALQYFQNAMDLDQDYYEAIDMMAVTLTEMKDTLARFYYDRLLKLNPNDANTYFKLGVYYMGLGNINRALESYTRALQLNPRDADSYYNLAFMYVELKEYDQARENFTKAIRFQERNYKAHYGRGFTFEVVGDIANARKDYEKALEILPIYKPAGEALARLNQQNAQ